MCAMLLTSFTRLNGTTYLNVSLAPPLKELIGKLEECEVDEIKLQKDTPPDLLQQKLESNRKNLKEVCNNLFNHIFKHQHRMPIPMARMCHFLDHSVYTHSENSAPSSASSEGNGRDSVMKRRLRSTTLPSGLTPLNTAPPISALIPESLVSPSHILTPNTAPIIKDMFNYAENNPTSTNIQSAKEIISRSRSSENVQGTQTPRHPSLKIKTTINVNDMPPMSAGANRSLGYLSNSQKVVGSFLFLRFFVPGGLY